MAMPARTTAAAFATAALGLAAGATVGGCGSSTKTVSVAGTPPVTLSTAAAGSTASAPPRTTTATTPDGTQAGGTAAPTTTRTASEPAFTEHQQSTPAGAAGTAAATLRAHGYAPVDVTQYHSGQTLEVLVGTRTAAEGNAQQAFFFIDGRYIGTDTSQPSAAVAVVSQSDTEVALAYTLRSGARATVRFQLNNGHLVPLDAIPPAGSRG